MRGGHGGAGVSLPWGCRQGHTAPPRQPPTAQAAETWNIQLACTWTFVDN